MRRVFYFLTGIGLGSAVMYIFDPDRGNRRRAFARDKMIHIVRTSERAMDKASRDLSHRAWGLVAEARSALGDGGASDMVLVNRVRSELGRTVSHPGAIDVTAAQGHVRLSGPVLASEVEKLIHAVSNVRGVHEVHNQLEVHQDATNVPALQGPGRTFEQGMLRENWPPAFRLIAGVGGAAIGLAGAKRRGVWGALLGLLGTALVTRAVMNAEISDLLGLEDGERKQARAGR